MIDMKAVLDSHYLMLALGWVFSGIIAYIAGFMTCFLWCNYKIVKYKEVTKDG